jgi:phospholipid-binding lipoprotein MlaA
MMRSRILNDIISLPARSRIKGPSKSPARARPLLSLAPGFILLVSIGLFGCSEHGDLWQTSYASDKTAILASDSPSPGLSEGMDYDPWESFNDETFDFNFNVLDRYALKPAAKVWSRVLPVQVRQSLGNAFYNLAMPKRFVNKVLQGRLPAAGEELVRFTLNTTVGFAGFFDVASRLGLDKSDADTGQTFGVFGVKAGPYLVLPLLPPLTVRDAFGYAADSFMDPLSWFVTPLGVDFGRAAANTINERADNMTEYDDVEDTSLDLYAAVRNGYLQRRSKSINDAVRDRDRTWESILSPFDAQNESTPATHPELLHDAVRKTQTN